MDNAMKVKNRRIQLLIPLRSIGTCKRIQSGGAYEANVRMSRP